MKTKLCKEVCKNCCEVQWSEWTEWEEKGWDAGWTWCIGMSKDGNMQQKIRLDKIPKGCRYRFEQMVIAEHNEIL